MKLESLGDAAVVATLGSGIDEGMMAAVRGLADSIRAAARLGITDIVPAYATVAVFYEPACFAEPGLDPYDVVCRFIESRADSPAHPSSAGQSKLEEIPVYYGGDAGPDMAHVAAHCRLGVEEVTALHCSVDYIVHAIGFTPGFPYLGGLPEALRTPRRDTPRARVPAGSVAIGGGQTGIYPVDSPGGWHIIGRTPVPLFRPREKQAALLRPGDRVRFKPMSKEAFESWT